MSYRSLNQLDLDGNDEIFVQTGSQHLFRFYYYWNNLEDQTKISFKIGIGGLIFAIISLADSCLGICK